MNNFSPYYLNSKKFAPYAYLHEAFTPEECNKIKSYCNRLPLVDGKIDINNKDNKSNESVIKSTVRSNKLAWVSVNEENNWFHDRLASAVKFINEQSWNFDLEYISPLQYTKYCKVNDKYIDHIDMAAMSAEYRKLSFSLQLDDENSYKGCDLVITTGGTKENEIYTQRKQGTINFFPSFILHRVTPLISGQRNCIVGWVCGPEFK